MASACLPALGCFGCFCFGCCLLFLLAACEEESAGGGGVWAPHGGSQEEEGEARLAALQDVLEKLKGRCQSPVGKKLSWVPSCDAGEPCAVRKGSRIGRLCRCPRALSCNLYLLKCL